MLILNYLLTASGVLTVKCQNETFPIYRAIARSMRQSRRLSSPIKTERSCLISSCFFFFLQARNRPVGYGRMIDPRISQSEHALYPLQILAI